MSCPDGNLEFLAEWFQHMSASGFTSPAVLLTATGLTLFDLIAASEALNEENPFVAFFLPSLLGIGAAYFVASQPIDGEHLALIAFHASTSGS
jgi:hypothetical protein